MTKLILDPVMSLPILDLLSGSLPGDGGGHEQTWIERSCHWECNETVWRWRGGKHNQPDLIKLWDTSRKSLQAGQSSCHATEMEGQESPRTSPDIREVKNFSIVLIGSIIKDLFWASYFSGKTEEKTCRPLWHRLRVLGRRRRRRKGGCLLNLDWGLMILNIYEESSFGTSM